MQRMDSLDSSQERTFFKKRTHRPWNPAVQMQTKTPEETVSTNVTTTELEAEQRLKTKELHEINTQLAAQDENRLLIGGFLYPKNIFSSNEDAKIQKSSHLMGELKNKEREMQALENDLKVARALEYAEKMELAKKKEEEAKKAAEAKVLLATQQIKLSEEQVLQAKQQIEIEQQLKIEEAKIRKILEDELKNALEEITQNALKIEQETNVRKILEEKLKETTQNAEETQQKIRLAHEQNTREILQNASKQEQQFRLDFEEKIKTIVSQSNVYQKENLNLENLVKQYVSALQEIEAAKQALEEELVVAQKNITESQNEKSHLEKQLSQELLKIRTLGSIIENERSLRKILQEKFNESQTPQARTNEFKRKISENKILELSRQIGDLAIAKSESQEKLSEAMSNIHQFEIMISSEKTLRKSLEEKMQAFMEKNYELERLKQNALNAQELAEQQVSILISQQQNLEQEKGTIHKKFNALLEHTHTLEMALESEKHLRKEAERLKDIEEQARKTTQEKIYSAMAQVNHAVLTISGDHPTTEASDVGT